MNKTDRIKNKLRQDDRKQTETKTYEANRKYLFKRVQNLISRTRTKSRQEKISK